MSDSTPPWQRRVQAREPAFNVAPVVIALAVIFLGIEALREWVLSEATDTWVFYAFAFIPARELLNVSWAGVPGGDAARFWSPLTYGFLHGGWLHVGFNVAWMIVFGSPLAWRFGTIRFLLLSAVGAVAGALVHFAFYSGDMTPVVGASAAISAQIAATARFAFVGRLPVGAPPGAAAYRTPALTLRETLTNRTALAFLGAWLGTNLLLAVPSIGAGLSAGATVAWDAHLGGFAVGLLLFSLFDPV